MRTFIGAAVAALSVACAAAPLPPVEAPVTLVVPPAPAPAAQPAIEDGPRTVRRLGFRLSYAVPPGWTHEVTKDRAVLSRPDDDRAKIALEIMRTRGPSFVYADADELRRDFEESGWTVVTASSTSGSYGGRDNAEVDLRLSRSGPDPDGPDRKARALIIYDGVSTKAALFITGEWPGPLDDLYSAEMEEQRRTARLVPEDRTDGARAQ